VWGRQRDRDAQQKGSLSSLSLLGRAKGGKSHNKRRKRGTSKDGKERGEVEKIGGEETVQKSARGKRTRF